jgi:hypothetical protein
MRTKVLGQFWQNYQTHVCLSCSTIDSSALRQREDEFLDNRISTSQLGERSLASALSHAAEPPAANMPPANSKTHPHKMPPSPSKSIITNHQSVNTPQSTSAPRGEKNVDRKREFEPKSAPGDRKPLSKNYSQT